MLRSGSSILRQGSNIARRNFSDASHRPVITIHGIHARYANATYVAASKAGVLDQVESELGALVNTAKSNPGFATFLENPMIPRDQKVSQVTELTSGGNFSSITSNLLTTMAGNARLGDLVKVAGTYEELMKAKRGEVNATLISADKLSKKQSDAIAKAVMASMGIEGSGNVVLEQKVDPTILGGLQVQIGDKFLDLSVKSRLDEISRTPVN